MKRLRRKNIFDYSWRAENGVYVGRPTKWGNPFRVGVDGDLETVLKKYEDWLRGELVDRPDLLEPLRGKNLACWCPLDQPCHADIIIKILKGED